MVLKKQLTKYYFISRISSCLSDWNDRSISELSNLALENKLLLHVDACIGGFLLSYLKKCNYNIPLFDFNLDGVSSFCRLT